MTKPERQIAIVDDDLGIRDAFEALLRAHGFTTRSFDTAEAFLRQGLGESWHCLILDVRLPGMTGLELQAKLAGKGLRIPVIFVTAVSDPGGYLAACAARYGAVSFLSKNSRVDQDLMRAIASLSD